MLNRIIIEKELREFFADLRLCLPSTLMCLLVPGIAATLVTVMFSLFPDTVYQPALQKLYFLSFLFVSSFPLSLTIPIALESYVGEKERKTFEILLSLPISERELYLSKMSAAFLIPAVLGAGSLVLFTLLAALCRLPLPPIGFLLIIFTMLIIKAMLLVSASCIISIGTSTIRAANVASSMVILPGTLLLGLESYLLYTGKFSLLACYLPALLVYALLFIFLGLNTFTRENQIVFRNEYSYLKNLWRQRVSIRDISKPAVLLVAAAFGLGLCSALLYCIANPVVPGASQPMFHEPATAADKPVLFWFILRHNIRAFLVLGVLALFSFGVIPAVSALFTGMITAVLIFSTGTATAMTGYSLTPFLHHRLLFLLVEIPVYLFLMILAADAGLRVFSRKSPGFLAAGSPLLKRYYWFVLLSLPLLAVAALLEIYFL